MVAFSARDHQPDFGRFRTVLLRTGEPDRVPLGDIGIHPLLKAGVLGRPIRGLEDEVAFWSAAGYDYVSLPQGLHLTNIIKRQSMRELAAHYAADTDEMQARSWATEGQGLITTMGDLDRVQWPDPEGLDYSSFERIGRLLAPGTKVIAIVGKVFTCVSWLMGLEGMSFALADEPDLVPAVFRRVAQFQYRVVERLLQFDCVGAI
jgi:uroporphyrinogen decarboxylase